MTRYIIRYGAMRLISVLSARNGGTYQRGDKVIIRTARGLEVGKILAPAGEECNAPAEDGNRGGGGNDANRNNARNTPTTGNRNGIETAIPGGQILREMTGEDANELAHLDSRAGEEFEICQKHIVQLGLAMQLVEVEHLFGGERIIVYYLADGRVDFRQLVRTLAAEFQTRIEMRQIGVRDEAKLLADFGDCGKPVCCKSHLVEMPPVSMKMAKLQKATLDPTKISGRCGRLKCCLRYEYNTYQSLQHELPPVNSEILTRQGRAKVLGQEILAQQLLVQLEDNRRLLIDADEVLNIFRRSGKGKANS